MREKKEEERKKKGKKLFKEIRLADAETKHHITSHQIRHPPSIIHHTHHHPSSAIRRLQSRNPLYTSLPVARPEEEQDQKKKSKSKNKNKNKQKKNRRKEEEKLPCCTLSYPFLLQQKNITQLHTITFYYSFLGSKADRSFGIYLQQDQVQS